MEKKFKVYEERLKEVLSLPRYQHSIRVVETAMEICRNLEKVNKDKLTLAALIHDVAKEIPGEKLIKISQEKNRRIDLAEKINPEILHGPVGAIILEEDWGIKDREILRAVEYHTTAASEMTDIEKIVYLADTLEPDRNYSGIEKLRDLAKKDLELTFKLTLDHVIKHVIEKDLPLHPMTVEARNSLLYLEEAGGYKYG